MFENMTISNLNKKVKELLKNSFLKSYCELEFTLHDGKYVAWLNPNNQFCFNFGWFEYQDFVDWTNGTGKIIKGNTQKEKDDFWYLAEFNAKDKNYLSSAILYDLKFFDMINENFSYAEEEILKIKKDNHDIIIGNVFGRIIRWYMDSYDFDKSKEKLNSELTGAGLSLTALGVGQYGACNIYQYGNISWFIELAMSKAKYLNLLHHKEKLPNYDYFVKLID